MERPINTILYEIRRGTVDQIKAGKRIRIYLVDAGKARYAENRKACCKQYHVLECEDFVRHIETAMIENSWSTDASVVRAQEAASFSKNLCTKTIYNYIDLGLLWIKNHHLSLKFRRKAKRSVIRKNKKIPGKTVGTVMAELEGLREDFDSGSSRVFKAITSDNGSEFPNLQTLKSVIRRSTSLTLIPPLSEAPMNATTGCSEGLSRKESGSLTTDMRPSAYWRVGSMVCPGKSWGIRLQENSLT